MKWECKLNAYLPFETHTFYSGERPCKVLLPYWTTGPNCSTVVQVQSTHPVLVILKIVKRKTHFGENQQNRGTTK